MEEIIADLHNASDEALQFEREDADATVIIGRSELDRSSTNETNGTSRDEAIKSTSDLKAASVPPDFGMLQRLHQAFKELMEKETREQDELLEEKKREAEELRAQLLKAQEIHVATEIKLMEKDTELFFLQKTMQDLKSERDRLESNMPHVDVDALKSAEVLEANLEQLKIDYNKQTTKLDSYNENEKTLKLLLCKYDYEMKVLHCSMNKERNEFKLYNERLGKFETSFSDVHNRYEKCKAILDGYAENAKIITEQIKREEETAVVLQTAYDELKAESERKLTEADDEYNSKKAQYADERYKLGLRIETLKIQLNSLEQEVSRKNLEFETLTKVLTEFS